MLAGFAALAVAGCSASSATPQTIYVTPSPSLPAASTAPISAPTGTATAAPTTAPSAAPVAVAPTVTSTTVNSSAPDNSWTVTFREPVVSGVAEAVLSAMNDSIDTRVGAYISSFNGTELPAVASGEGPSTLNGDFSVAYLSPSLLSLRFTITTYITGAAHPLTEAGSINFDVSSGAVIQLSDLFTSPASAVPVLQTQAHAKLSALLGADLSWPASVTMADFETGWVFTPAGLELTWSQGTIASMAAGTPTISIPWPSLASVIATPGPAAGFVA